MTKSVVGEVNQKIDRLTLPKSISIRPVLIHVNGVEDSILDMGYFDKIIDFEQLLE